MGAMGGLETAREVVGEVGIPVTGKGPMTAIGVGVGEGVGVGAVGAAEEGTAGGDAGGAVGKGAGGTAGKGEEGADGEVEGGATSADVEGAGGEVHWPFLTRSSSRRASVSASMESIRLIFALWTPRSASNRAWKVTILSQAS